MSEVSKRRCIRFDGTWHNDAQTIVTIDVDIDPFGNVLLEMSNIIDCSDQDVTFEEGMLMSPAQFKVFAAAIKAMADTL